MNSTSIVVISCKCKANHTTKFFWESITDNRNYTCSTKCDKWECKTVVARNYFKMFWFIFDNSFHLAQIARSFFDCYYIFKLVSNAQCGFCSHINTYSAWHVVKNYWHWRCLCNSSKVLIHTLL